ncbi:MAG: hypothetical protein ACR2PW_01105, partial [Gammaproteobacteria bacterium]
MRFDWSCVLPVVLSLAVVTASASAQPIADRVLFVGNSFTYYNDSLHNHIGNLLKAAGLFRPEQTRLRALTLSGGRLQEQIAGIKAITTRDQRWQLVVLQGHSSAFSNSRNARNMRTAARTIAQHVRSQGSLPALFMTWGYKNEPEMIQALQKGYTQLGEEINAVVLPVGLAFERVRRQHPEIELFSLDIEGFRTDAQGQLQPHYKQSVKHPNAAGTYLSACVVFAVLTNQSPLGLAYDAGLGHSHAKILQQAA